MIDQVITYFDPEDGELCLQCPSCSQGAEPEMFPDVFYPEHDLANEPVYRAGVAFNTSLQARGLNLVSCPHCGTVCTHPYPLNEGEMDFFRNYKLGRNVDLGTFEFEEALQAFCNSHGINFETETFTHREVMGGPDGFTTR